MGRLLSALAALQDGRSASLTAPNGPAQARLGGGKAPGDVYMSVGSKRENTRKTTKTHRFVGGCDFFCELASRVVKVWAPFANFKHSKVVECF